MRGFTCSLSGAILVILSFSQAEAGIVIQVNLKGPLGGVYVAPGNWNNLGSPPNTTVSNLKDFNTGLATDADLTTSSWSSSTSSSNMWTGGNKGWMLDVAGDTALYDSFGTASAKFSDLSGVAYTVEVVSSDRLEYVYDISIGGAFADANYNATPGVNGDGFRSTTDGRNPANWLIWNNVVPINGGIQIDFDAGNVVGNFFTLNALRLSEAAVPEPSTYAMMGLCLLGMAGYGWRRRQKQTA